MLALLNLLKQLFLQTKLKPGLCDIPMVDASTHLELLGFIQTFTGLQKPPAVAFFGKVCIGDIDQTRAFWKARTQDRTEIPEAQKPEWMAKLFIVAGQC